MTQEEKNLLLKDLCSRLPYGVKASTKIGPIIIVSGIYEDTIKDETEDSYDVSFIKPYLRPMSSMTVVERKDLRRLTDAISIYNDGLEFESHDGYNDYIGYCFCSEIVDWLNAHHFDYYGLIPMGLALEAPEGMYIKQNRI